MSNSITVEKSKKCVFCNPQGRTFLINTNDFIVMADEYPPKEGYLLIFARQHFYSMAELSSAKYAELTALQDRCKAMIFDIWGEQASCGEHGIGHTEREQEKTSASIMHAHRHIAPIEDYAETELIIESEMQQINSFDDLRNSTVKSYIWLEDIHGQQYVTYKPMRKQILRSAIARGTNTENDYIWQMAKPEILEIYRANESKTIAKVQEYCGEIWRGN